MAEPREKLSVTFEGLAEDARDMRLRAFARKVDDLRDALRLSGYATGSRSASDFLIVDMRRESPATITFNPLDELAEEAAATLVRGINTLRNLTSLPADYAEELFDAVKKMLDGFGRTFGRINLRIGKAVVATVDAELYESVRQIEAGDVIAYGSVKGAIERFNSHGGANYFYLYPRRGKGIRCEFANDLLLEAAEAVTRSATVSGLLRYHAHRFEPYVCKVREIQINPDDSELPMLTSLRGIAPGMTGDSDTLEFIRSARLGWKQ